MTGYMHKNKIPIFDYAKFAGPFREKIRADAGQLAAANSIAIEFVRSSKARKEDMARRHFDGKKTGLVYILSAMASGARI